MYKICALGTNWISLPLTLYLITTVMVITPTERNIFGTFLFWKNSFEEEKNFRSYRKCEWVLSLWGQDEDSWGSKFCSAWPHKK